MIITDRDLDQWLYKPCTLDGKIAHVRYLLGKAVIMTNDEKKRIVIGWQEMVDVMESGNAEFKSERKVQG